MFNVLIRYGCTKIVISDQGREFVNRVSQDLFALTKTQHKISTAYHPQTNGLVERFNQTIQRSLLKLVKKEQDDWDEYIDGVLFGYRTAIQKSTMQEVTFRSDGLTGSKVKIVEEMPIYCVCRMPELPDSNWIECSSCKEWYHSDTCVKVPPKCLATNVLWHCAECT